jgi:hypothetical protein
VGYDEDMTDYLKYKKNQIQGGDERRERSMCGICGCKSWGSFFLKIDSMRMKLELSPTFEHPDG